VASAESMRSALVSRSALRCKDSRLDFYVRFVTLRRVLATSWKAIGRIRPIWSRLDAPKERRELLARLTRIPAPDLSAMNTGKRPMTMAKAERIMAAVPGVTLLDLGAPVAGEGTACPSRAGSRTTERSDGGCNVPQSDEGGG